MPCTTTGCPEDDLLNVERIRDDETNTSEISANVEFATTDTCELTRPTCHSNKDSPASPISRDLHHSDTCLTERSTDQTQELQLTAPLSELESTALLSDNHAPPSLYSSSDLDSGPTASAVDRSVQNALSLQELSAIMLARIEKKMPGMSGLAQEVVLRAISAKIQGQDLSQLKSGVGFDIDGMVFGQAGTELVERFGTTRDMRTLVEGISLLRVSLEYFPHGHNLRDRVLNNLATALRDNSERTGNSGMLTESITLHREALLLRPNGHPDRHATLHNLANSLLTHFEHEMDKNLNELAESIVLLWDSLLLTPHGHPLRDTILQSLAHSLFTHFRYEGDKSSLTESISLLRESLLLRPRTHPDRHATLNNLANSLLECFQHGGNRNELAESISLYRESLLLRPYGHPDHHMSLNNLATSLLIRFEHEGDKDALTESISLHRESLLYSPRGHPEHYTSLNNLANSLSARFKHEGDPNALTESIALLRQSLLLAPHGHPLRHTGLSNLANALMEQFKSKKDVDLITESILLYQQAVELVPPGHPDYGGALHNLSNAHARHFLYDGNEKSLATELSLRKQCLDVWHDGHLRRHDAHFCLANIRLHDSTYFNWEEALDHISAGIGDKMAPARYRLRNITQTLWLVERATTRNQDQFLYSSRVLSLYVSAIRLLPRVAHFGLDVTRRLNELSGSEQLCRTAATRALLISQPLMAIELLEEGKNVFWQQALQLRSSALDNLPEKDRRRLLSLFQELERDSSRSGQSADKAAVERDIDNRRRLSEEAEDLIEEIRTRTGFDHFLATPNFWQLCEAAANGPVVILNDSPWMNAALIVNVNWPEKARVIQLLRHGNLQNLSEKVAWYNLRGETSGPHPEVTDNDSDVGRGLGVDRGRTRTVLAELWEAVVKPVIEEIGLQVACGRNRPRLYWCPNGKFNLLPLHAAGIYEGENQVCVSHYVVSSYTPSLSALIKARKDFTAIPRENLKALVAAEPAAPGLPPLPSVEGEVETVVGLMMSVSAAVMNDLDATPTTQSILHTLPSAHFFHLACHGQQHSNPLQSSFALRDGRLTISSLMRLNLPNAILAFLSACETAKGDREQPDQAVHLAASMLFCGFRSVLATMWAMHDMDGPLIAQWFYESLFENEMVDLDGIAYALDEAVQRLRKTGARPVQWATFLHMGG